MREQADRNIEYDVEIENKRSRIEKEIRVLESEIGRKIHSHFSIRGNYSYEVYTGLHLSFIIFTGSRVVFEIPSGYLEVFRPEDLPFARRFGSILEKKHGYKVIINKHFVDGEGKNE